MEDFLLRLLALPLGFGIAYATIQATRIYNSKKIDAVAWAVTCIATLAFFTLYSNLVVEL